MTDAEASLKRVMDYMDQKLKEIQGSKEAGRKFLIDIGAETEESMRDHEEKLKKGRMKK